MTLKSKLMELLKEMVLSRKSGPFSKRIFQCSECVKLVISNSKAKAVGCPVSEEHVWHDVQVRL